MSDDGSPNEATRSVAFDVADEETRAWRWLESRLIERLSAARALAAAGARGRPATAELGRQLYEVRWLGFVMLRYMSRIVAFVIVLVAIDAAVCPVLCLNLDTPSHQTSRIPSQGVGCGGGFCSSGLLPVCAEQPETLTPTALRLTEGHTFRPGLDPTADIDHPPRFV